MKMMSSTSITSTSGTTLISAIDEDTRRTRPPRPVETSSVGLSFGMARRPPGRSGLREVTLGDVQELERESSMLEVSRSRPPRSGYRSTRPESLQNSPAAVAISASAMPGATTPRLVDPTLAMRWNDVMMPQTVPNSPMKGEMLAVVASTDSHRSIFVTSTAAARSSARSPTRGSSVLDVRRGLADCRSVAPPAAQLRVQLGIARLKMPAAGWHQRSAYGMHLGELRAAAEHVQEPRGLALDPIENAQSVKDNAPGHDRKPPRMSRMNFATGPDLRPGR